MAIIVTMSELAIHSVLSATGNLFDFKELYY